MWPENWGIACLFLKCAVSQWVLSPQGRVLGFNYPGVEVVMRHNTALVPDAALAFDQLQGMEAAARGVLNG